MGVSERSPAGIAIARANSALRADSSGYCQTLRRRIVIGSPYRVRRYTDEQLGELAGLAEARESWTGAACA
ncbi:MAG: hypothetical protein AB7G68_09205 [Nitrospiraceae bacterium]